MQCCKYVCGTVAATVLAIAAGAAMSGWAHQPADKKDSPAHKAAQPPAGGMPEMSPEEKAWMDAAMPGEAHARLAQLAGTWDAVVKFWDPNTGKESTSGGTMVNTMIHDGRWLQHEFKGSFTFAEGMPPMPFTGSGLWGYNNVTKKYESTWTDNMSTGIMMSSGSYDAASNSYTMTSEMESPMGGKVKHREVFKILGPDKHVMEMYGTEAGKPEKKVMEITYTRAGGAKSPAAKPAGH